MIKLQKLYNYELMNEKTGHSLASYQDAEDYICEGGELPEGKFLELMDGWLYIDDGKLDFYSKLEVCVQMLPGIAETYI